MSVEDGHEPTNSLSRRSLLVTAVVRNMPIERPFGKWNVVAVFNYTNRASRTRPPQNFTATVDAKDLRLDPNKEDMAYEAGQRMLRGVSRAVAGDAYQLRIYLPDGFSGKRVELPAGLTGILKTEGNLLTADFTATTWPGRCTSSVWRK